MKKYLTIIICIILLCITMYYINPITDKLADIISNNTTLVIRPKNSYTKDTDYLFVQKSDDYIPYSYQDILNIYYSVIDNGWDTFTFYCPSEYENCILDIETISSDELILTHLNNYVHPFNSFTNIKTSISESGEITLTVSYLYTDSEIDEISSRVDELIDELINDEDSDYDKIKTIHDYIINNTQYDVERNETGESSYNSYKAYGALFEGYATCNGYTDLMAIFLSAMGYNNYKIATTPDEISYSSTGHIWNAVYLDGEWLHVDLTWDDPVSSDGKNYLYHTYFLVTTDELKEADKSETVNIEEHNFNTLYYLEFN